MSLSARDAAGQSDEAPTMSSEASSPRDGAQGAAPAEPSVGTESTGAAGTPEMAESQGMAESPTATEASNASASEEPPRRPMATPPRGNRSLDREQHPTRVVIGAAGRFSVLAGSGAEAVQPFGGGFGVFARFTPWHAGIARFGFGFDGGYARWTERVSVPLDDGMGGETSVRRAKVLGHADLSVGPNVELVAGPVLVQVATGVGVGIDAFLRPASDPANELNVTSVDFLSRSSVALAFPIYRDQGLAIGGALGKYVTRSRVALPELAEPEVPAPRVAIFDLVVETYLAYLVWF